MFEKNFDHEKIACLDPSFPRDEILSFFVVLSIFRSTKLSLFFMQIGELLKDSAFYLLFFCVCFVLTFFFDSPSCFPPMVFLDRGAFP